MSLRARLLKIKNALQSSFKCSCGGKNRIVFVWFDEDTGKPQEGPSTAPCAKCGATPTVWTFGYETIRTREEAIRCPTGCIVRATV